MDGHPSPGHPTHRLVRGLAALATLFALLVAVPAVLIGAAGDPLPGHLPGPGAILHALITADRSGAIVVGTALYVAWAAWLGFTAAVLLEATGRLRNRPSRRLPGLRVLQRAAAGLLTSVALMTGTAGMVAAAPLAAVAAAAPAALTAAPDAAPARPAVTAPGPTLVYQVAHDDDLGTIATRFLGRFEDFPRIAAVNPDLITDAFGPHGPDHIQPGWRLVLPPGARDRGAREWANGWVVKTRVPGAPATPGGSGKPATDPSGVPSPSGTPGGLAGTPAPAPPGRSDPTAAPTPPHMGDPEPVPHAAGATGGSGHAGADPGPLLAIGGLGFGLLGAHLAVRRRRRNAARHATGGRHQRALGAHAAAGPPDAGPAAEFNRLDLALRDLATLLGDRDGGQLPDIMGSWLVDGAVHLMLTRPCPAPPPWIENDLVWTLPAHAPVHTYFSAVAAPLPALVTVGGRDDKRVFLDLERLGVVTIGGDPQGATGLLRHVGAELCHGIWTDGVTVGIAGFTRQDTHQLITLGGGRVRDAGSIPDALDSAARFVDEAADRLSGLGAADVLSARVAARPGDAKWLSPYALLLAGPDAADLQRLENFDAYLAELGRGQVAIATTTQARLGRWPIRVDAQHQVTMDFLDARVPAVSLAGAELAALADAPDRARMRPEDKDVPVGRHRARRAPAA